MAGDVPSRSANESVDGQNDRVPSAKELADILFGGGPNEQEIARKEGDRAFNESKKQTESVVKLGSDSQDALSQGSSEIDSSGQLLINGIPVPGLQFRGDVVVRQNGSEPAAFLVFSEGDKLYVGLDHMVFRPKGGGRQTVPLDPKFHRKSIWLAAVK